MALISKNQNSATQKDPNNYESFYPKREIPEYESDTTKELLELALSLKERRKTSVEMLLYGNIGAKAESESILSGENQLLIRERDNYLKHLIAKHASLLPQELKDGRIRGISGRIRKKQAKGKEQGADKKNKEGTGDKDEDLRVGPESESNGAGDKDDESIEMSDMGEYMDFEDNDNGGGDSDYGDGGDRD